MQAPRDHDTRASTTHLVPLFLQKAAKVLCERCSTDELLWCFIVAAKASLRWSRDPDGNLGLFIQAQWLMVTPLARQADVCRQFRACGLESLTGCTSGELVFSSGIADPWLVSEGRMKREGWRYLP
jgi:hypothetical protein